jgi:hypothetical protein
MTNLLLTGLGGSGRFRPRELAWDLRFRSAAPSALRGTVADRVGTLDARIHGVPALAFDGSGDYLSGNSSLLTGSDWSFDAWLRPGFDPAIDSGVYTILTDWSSGECRQVFYSVSGGETSLKVRTDETTLYAATDASVLPAQGEWAYLRVRVSGSTVEAALNDGPWVSLAGETDLYSPGDSGIRLGSFVEDNLYWDGRLVAVGLRNDADPPSRYNDPQPADLSGYAAFWRFDEGSGSTLADATGNGHDLSITGASWTTDADDNDDNLGTDGSGDYWPAAGGFDLGRGWIDVPGSQGDPVFDLPHDSTGWTLLLLIAPMPAAEKRRWFDNDSSGGLGVFWFGDKWYGRLALGDGSSDRFLTVDEPASGWDTSSWRLLAVDRSAAETYRLRVARGTAIAGSSTATGITADITPGGATVLGKNTGGNHVATGPRPLVQAAIASATLTDAQLLRLCRQKGW